jgi:hypothetical protein
VPRGRPRGSKSKTLACSTKGIPNAARRRRQCLTCAHPERARIDYLAARGSSLPGLARKYGLSPTALFRHCRNHISAEYRNVVTSSPLESLESLQKLACESGASVVDNLSAIYGALSSRFLDAFEAGGDHRIAILTTRMHQNLQLRAQISRELLPSGSTFNSVTNNLLLSDAGQLLKILRDYPEARQAIVSYYSERGTTKVIEHHAAAGD